MKCRAFALSPENTGGWAILVSLSGVVLAIIGFGSGGKRVIWAVGLGVGNWSFEIELRLLIRRRG